MANNLKVPGRHGIGRNPLRFFRPQNGISFASLLWANGEVQVKRFVLIAFVGLPTLGRALDVTPTFFQLRGVPNARLKAEVTVLNDTSAPVEVRLDLHEVSDGWITIAPSTLKIGAGQSRVARLSVRVPRGQGERTAQVRARVQGPLASSEIRVIRKVNLTIAGTEKYGFSFDTINTVDQGDRVAMDVVFKNDGNITLRPTVGALISVSDGTQASAFQEGRAAAVGPGQRGSARVVVPLAGRRWEGHGTVTIYALDFAGETRRVEKKIGD